LSVPFSTPIFALRFKKFGEREWRVVRGCGAFIKGGDKKFFLQKGLK